MGRWVDEIGRVLPPGQYPIADIPIDHAIMHTLYDVKQMAPEGYAIGGNFIYVVSGFSRT